MLFVLQEELAELANAEGEEDPVDDEAAQGDRTVLAALFVTSEI